MHDFPDIGKSRKILLIMKLKIFIIFCCVGSLQANVYSQVQYFDLQKTNVPITDVLEEIQERSDYRFFYRKEIFDAAPQISVHATKIALPELLDEVLTKQGFGYEILEKVITIHRLQKQEQIQIVRGIVKDSGKQPLPGVTVMIKGTTVGTVTDAEGRYSLTVPDFEQVVLVYSFIGMKTQEVTYKGEKSLEVVLKEDVTEMDEVVVTGIFSKSKESYTGAVTTITSKELQRVGNRSILTSIRNIDPSFNIAENIEIGSDPNQLPDIVIRGGSSLDTDLKDLQTDSRNQGQQNQPLFIMDGFEISLQRMMDMDENQIETITLLKDASATAMYGARGANGVVVITTKKPEAGKLNITYRGGVNLEIPDLTSYNLLSAKEKIDYEVAAGIYENSDVRLEQRLLELLNRRRLEVARGVNTYWLKYPVRTGVGTRHSLRLEGGDENIRYAASVGYNYVAGVMKESARKTLTSNMFFSYRYKNLTFQNDFNFTSNKANNSPYENFYVYTQQNPYWKPYDDEGKIIKVLEDEIINGQRFYKLNPLYNATLPYKNESGYKNIQNNLAVEWQILSGLSLRGRLGLN